MTIEELIMKAEKLSNKEYEERTTVTGYFEEEYSRGFCDGMEWLVMMLRKEISK